MTAAERAIDATRRIRQVMLDLGRPVTIEEIAEATGLQQSAIRLRLTANTLGNMTPAYAWFAKGPHGWGLTQRGREESA